MTRLAKDRSLVGAACRFAGAVAVSWPLAVLADEPSRPLKPTAPCPVSDTLAQDFPLGWFPKDIEKGGVQVCLNYTGETLGDVSGGTRRGGIYEGRLEGIVHADLQTLMGWTGATFHANAFQIHGHGLSRYYVNNLFTASNIEALSSTRLSELWLEQELGGWGSLRIGQLAADTEFVTSSYAGLFVNSTFGFPAIAAAGLPSGGPAYPLATPGVRLKIKASDEITLLAAIFNGDPAGRGAGDPQRRDRDGTNFRLSDPPLFFAEAQYAYSPDQDGKSRPGTLKLGGWYHAGRFDDLRVGSDGLSLADPASSGIASRRRGNGGGYAIMDQAIWRDGTAAGEGGAYAGPEIGVFTRVAFSPSDRSLIDAYVDGGVSFKGLVPGRPSDTFGVALGYGSISSTATGFDRDTAFFTQTPTVVRDHEALIEVTYQAQLRSGWILQPDFQYIFHPGGHVPDSRNPTLAPIRDAAVFGLRTLIRY